MTSGGIPAGAKGIRTYSGHSPYEKYAKCGIHGFQLRETLHRGKNGKPLCPVELWPGGRCCHMPMIQWPREPSETKQRIKKLLRLEIPLLVKIQ